MDHVDCTFLYRSLHIIRGLNSHYITVSLTLKYSQTHNLSRILSQFNSVSKPFPTFGDGTNLLGFEQRFEGGFYFSQ